MCVKGLVLGPLTAAHCFADDMELYLAFNSTDSDTVQNAAIIAIKMCLRDIPN